MPDRGAGGLLPALLAVLVLGWWWRGSTLTVGTVTAVALSADAPDSAVLDASGYVVARRQCTVSAKVTGKVTEVHVEEGMPVRQGQVLARLDASQARPARVLARRQVEATAGGLKEVGVRLDAARSDVAALGAQQEALQGQLDVARSTLTCASRTWRISSSARPSTAS